MTRVFLFLFLPIFVYTQNALPEISNLTADMDEMTSTITLHFDVEDAENEALEITFLASNDNGETFLLNTANAIGDIGYPIMPGTDKMITWNYGGLLTGSGDYQLKIVADDLFQLDIQEIVNQVDSNRLRANLEFVEGVRHRISGEPHLEAVKDSIEAHFLAHDLETHRMDFIYQNYTGQNIIGRKQGTTKTDSTYIVDGHFDTVSNSPGADDNGSAVVGMMEVLRVLSPYSFKKSIRFIGFDLEEAGLRGSLAYVAAIPPTETIEGVFNLEMIGYFTNQPNTQDFPNGFQLLYPDVYDAVAEDDFRGNFITNIGDVNSEALQAAYDTAAVRYVPDLRVISIIAPPTWATLTPDLGRSDHAAFWLQNMPALMLTDGSNFRNPHYHSPNDIVETLDFTFMANVVKATVGALAEEAEITHSSSATFDFSIVSNTANSLHCGWSIYPTPADKELVLSFMDCFYDYLEVELFDIMGRSVLRDEVRLSSVKKKYLDISFLEKGIYLLTIRYENKFLNKKIIVN